MYVDIFSIYAIAIFYFYYSNMKWLQLIKVTIRVYFFGEELMFHQLDMPYCFVLYSIFHRRAVMCLNNKCIALCSWLELLYLFGKTPYYHDFYYEPPVSFCQFSAATLLHEKCTSQTCQARAGMFNSHLNVGKGWKKRANSEHISPMNFWGLSSLWKVVFEVWEIWQSKKYSGKVLLGWVLPMFTIKDIFRLILKLAFDFLLST